MKINWGYKIMMVYIVFVVGILGLSFWSARQQMDLVTPDYYAEELKHQEKIDAGKQSAALSEPLRYELKDNKLTIFFPKDVAGHVITGDLLLYCPSDKGNDVKQTIHTAEKEISFVLPQQPAGLREIQINWQANGVQYYFEQKLFI
jgi:hypothetical protein